ncbi:MAG: TolC family protein [Treponema sp.]|jgi:multidrug efflux system outer membrane protein|nr:TolC family protein [Treponema sp.]
MMRNLLFSRSNCGIFTHLWLSVLVFCGIAPLGAAPQTLSLEEAMEMAVAQSLSLQKNSIDVATAGFAAKSTWSEILSVVNPSLLLSYGDNLFSGDGFQFDKANGSFSIQAGVNISFNTGLPQTIRLTSLAYQSQLLTYENARRVVERDVTRTFYSRIADRNTRMNRERALELAEKQYERNRVSFEYGLTSRLDYLRSQLSVETARLSLNQQEAVYAANMRNFLTTLGLDYDPEITLAGELNIVKIDLDPEPLIQQHLFQRLDILMQQQVIQRTELQVKQQTFAPWLSASVQYQAGTAPAGNQPRVGATAWGADMQFADRLSTSVTLTIPINNWIPGTSANRQLRSANETVEKARIDMQTIENNARNEIRSLTDSLRNSWFSIEIARLQVEIAEQTYSLSEEGFQQGVVETLTLEENRNSLSSAQDQLLSTEHTYYGFMLDLASALNISIQDLITIRED